MKLRRPHVAFCKKQEDINLRKWCVEQSRSIHRLATIDDTLSGAERIYSWICGITESQKPNQ